MADDTVYNLRDTPAEPVRSAQPEPGRPAPLAAAQSPLAVPPRSDMAPFGLEVVGREQIEIAPHPTTNRFPWAPVANPTVPVYQQTQPTPPAPVALPPIDLPPASVPTPVPSAPPEPEPMPEPPPEPISEPVPETPPLVVVAAPPKPPAIPKLQSEPAPAPEIEPDLVLPPLPVNDPVVPVAVEPVLAVEPSPQVTLEPQPAPPIAEPQSLQPPPLHVKRPAPTRQNHHHGIRLYSVQTREVWRIFRIGRQLRVVYFIAFGLIALIVIIFLIQLGNPANIFHLKFLQPILNAQ